MSSTPRPLVVFVSGPPASGKTTLGRRLSADLRLPYFSKDGFKELLFDELGWGDRAVSRRHGKAAYALLGHVSEACLRAGLSVLLESNFTAEYDGPRFRDLQERAPFDAVQVMCWARAEVRLARYR